MQEFKVVISVVHSGLGLEREKLVKPFKLFTSSRINTLGTPYLRAELN